VRHQAHQPVLNFFPAQLADLRAELDQIQTSASTQSGSAKDLQARIDELKLVAGLNERTGDGGWAPLRAFASWPRLRWDSGSVRLADLTGADLRGANLGGADLRDSLFLTQSQVDSARGDGGTRLPGGIARPAHWSTAERPGAGEAL